MTVGYIHLAPFQLFTCVKAMEIAIISLESDVRTMHLTSDERIRTYEAITHIREVQGHIKGFLEAHDAIAIAKGDS